MSTITERIRTIRTMLDYKQDVMADELDISQTAYSYLENNDEDKLTIGRLSKIAAIFNISLNELATGRSGVRIERVSLNQQGGHTNGVIFQSVEWLGNARTIGSRIRQLRKKQNLSQKDMASRMGISQKTYSMLESTDDDSQKIGRLKHVAQSLLLTDWTELLPPDRHISIGTVSENQRGGLTNGIMFSADDTLYHRVQELENFVTGLSPRNEKEPV